MVCSPKAKIIEQEYQKHGHGQMYRAMLHVHQRSESRRVDMEYGERTGDNRHDDGTYPGHLTEAKLRVVFF